MSQVTMTRSPRSLDLRKQENSRQGSGNRKGMQSISLEESQMLNTHSRKGKYILASLVGAGVCGLIIALTALAVPKMKDLCKRMMAGMEQGPQQATQS